MDCNKQVPRILGAVLLSALSASVFSQSGTTYKSICIGVGNNPPEQLSDRAGQAVAAGTFACRVEGGPLDGGATTGTSIWHYNKLDGVLLAGSGVTRRAGAYAVWDQEEAKITLTTAADGRVTGFTGWGRGRFPLATGSADPLNGKTYTFKFASTGPAQFVVETVVD